MNNCKLTIDELYSEILYRIRSNSESNARQTRGNTLEVLRKVNVRIERLITAAEVIDEIVFDYESDDE